MRIELQFVRLAAPVLIVIVVAVVLVNLPVSLPHSLDKAAHFIAFSMLTLLLWKATGMPLFAVAAALVFGALAELRQAYIPGRNSDAWDFLANLCGVLATGLVIFLQSRRACAESSRR